VGRVWAAVLLGCLLEGVARGFEPPLLPPPGVVTECHDDVQLFQSFVSGTVDYCRGHLRYVPGALDCYQVVERVCSVFLPASAEWTDTYYPRARVPFPCPDAPEPPVCRRLDVQ
jgi:hypothetical protein